VSLEYTVPIWVGVLCVVAAARVLLDYWRWPLIVAALLLGIAATIWSPQRPIAPSISKDAPTPPLSGAQTGTPLVAATLKPRKRAPRDAAGAEAAFDRIVPLQPRERATYKLAQESFRKRDYAGARQRFESLLKTSSAFDDSKSIATQMIKFNIYLTLLLEGYESAEKMRKQFEFTGDTPALYYANGAAKFKSGNYSKAYEWIESAEKIYSAEINSVFADPFYDLGWIAP
jgi:tetratricopeptide (TPR) repeat protein